MIDKLVAMTRSKKKLVMLLADSILLIIVLYISFSIRLGYFYTFESSLMLTLILCSPILGIPIFTIFGLYNAVIRHIGFKALWSVFQAVTFYALTWGIIGLMVSVSTYSTLPRSVVFINWMMAILVISGSRVLARIFLNNYLNFSLFNLGDQKNYKNEVRILIYGAGESGVQLLIGLENSKDHSVIAFLDDSENLQGQQVRGLNVFSLDKIDFLIENFAIDEVFIAMPKVSRRKRLKIINKLEPYSVAVKILPTFSELVKGELKVSDLREISINDLLDREEVEPFKDLLGKNILNKNIIVTGSGGSIGSELCRQIIRLKPRQLILFEVNELALYNIEIELKKLNTHSVKILPILGNITNKKRLNHVFNRFEIDTVYHTAAYKHVPMVEFNNAEGVDVNIFGTLNCAEVAIENNVNTFVLISTDKAVRPTNTMGASKRVAELILQAKASGEVNTKFSIVRFGNVLGSSGSVIPLFQKQINSGGPVTVTDKDIIRYFMTIPEAVELVIQAGALSEGGEVFVLDMGKPVLIKSLAEKMIHLSGLEVKNHSNPEGDIEIQYTGLRAGEKLFEELLIGNDVKKTINPLIMNAQEEMIGWFELEALINKLRSANEINDQKQVRSLLIQIVPGFNPKSKINDILYALN